MEWKRVHLTQLQIFHSVLRYYTNLKNYKAYQNTLKKSHVHYRINAVIGSGDVLNSLAYQHLLLRS